ncbi:hypothetical protein B5E58_03605 [Tyzzerella sp. An114]|uniref:hypothetical protein n=1 Tax=Tyzzerella sp. An114 TaxID=1965545 RepID=UPI000B43432E|nr:hypothetical protein [Tyzzerella sp. An114]OUQ59531.1 hypothetical protein B5E58_03605 [Tyzzerella sp. An114]
MDSKKLKIFEIIIIAVALLGRGYIGFVAWIIWALEIIVVKWIDIKKSDDPEALSNVKKEIPLYIGIFLFFIAVKFFVGTF